jgi:hypothetical protein
MFRLFIRVALGGKIKRLEGKRPDRWVNTGMMSETITLVAIRYERKNTYFCKLARIPQHQLSIY